MTSTNMQGCQDSAKPPQEEPGIKPHGGSLFQLQPQQRASIPNYQDNNDNSDFNLGHYRNRSTFTQTRDLHTILENRNTHPQSPSYEFLNRDMEEALTDVTMGLFDYFDCFGREEQLQQAWDLPHPVTASQDALQRKLYLIPLSFAVSTILFIAVFGDMKSFLFGIVLGVLVARRFN